MRLIDRLAYLRQRVKDQQEWLDKHGGDLAEYIRHYGDPGIAPCDKNGNAETITCPDDLARECGLRPVPNAQGCYFKEHFGSGGTLIYKADHDCLMRYKGELAELEPYYGRYLDAEIAESKAAKEGVQKYKGPTNRLTPELLLEDIEAVMRTALEGAQDSRARWADAGYEKLKTICDRLRLGRRCLGLAEPPLEMDDRPWS